VINKKGVAQHRFARVEEYAIYAFMPDATVPTNFDDLLGENNTTETFNEVVRWERLLRGGNNSRREDRPKMFYPVYIDPQKKVITGIGDILPLDQQPDLTNIDSKTIAWPIRSDQSLGHWQLQPSTFLELLKKGFVKVGTWDKKRKTWTILYLNNGTRKRINDGDIVITGRDELTNVVNVEFARPEAKMYAIKTVWNRKSHDSGVYGSTLLRNIIGRDRKFDFPKSVYSTKDAIQSILRNRPEALIVDFFAGSGTTQHAIDLINAEDGGTRNCICITNNEISVDEIKGFVKKNIRQGDPEWEAHGIAHYVTWPRTSCCINGVDVNGKPLSGSYIGSERPMSDGFEENAIFFDLEYLEPSVVQANMAFNEIAPLLWIKAGSKGRIIQHCDKYDISDNYAVLFDYRYIGAFTREVQKMPDVKTIFIVTDHDARYRDMCAAFPDRDVTQLYEAYLRSFEISSEG
jgi:adenine-specific DNA-methyltransferase